MIHLLAQELAVPDSYKGTVVSIVCGLIAGCVPYIISLLKAKAALNKEDRNLTIKERNQLTIDLRTEREVLRAEFIREKSEWKKELETLVSAHVIELTALRKENMECLKTSAKQEQLIVGLTRDIEDLNKQCKTLESNLAKLSARE